MSECDVSGHEFGTLRSFTGQPICSMCGAFDKTWTPPDEDDACDKYEEPIGSCDECGCNLWADDEYDGLCGQCAWLIREANRK